MRSDAALDKVVHLLVDRVGSIEDQKAVVGNLTEANMISFAIE